MKILEKIIEKVKNELNRKIQSNPIIDLTKNDYLEYLTEIFVINELIGFLNFELENALNCMGTKVNEDTYATIYFNCENISEQVIGEFYNNSVGTDIDGMTDIVYWIGETCEELEIPPYISLKNIENGVLATLKTDLHFAEFRIVNKNADVVSSENFELSIYKINRETQEKEGEESTRTYNGLDFSIFDNEKFIEFLEKEFYDMRKECL